MLLPPHQRVCVIGHLLDLHVRLKLGFPFDRGHVEIHGCGTQTQEFVQIATMLDLSIRVFHFSLSRLYVKTFQVHGKITEGIVCQDEGKYLLSQNEVQQTKAYYQAFFWVLIDLIVEFLVLIIKPFDNQTER
jgi:uncharacterized protein YqhQ